MYFQRRQQNFRAPSIESTPGTMWKVWDHRVPPVKEISEPQAHRHTERRRGGEAEGGGGGGGSPGEGGARQAHHAGATAVVAMLDFGAGLVAFAVTPLTGVGDVHGELFVDALGSLIERQLHDVLEKSRDHCYHSESKGERWLGVYGYCFF